MKNRKNLLLIFIILQFHYFIAQQINKIEFTISQFYNFIAQQNAENKQNSTNLSFYNFIILSRNK